MSPRTSPTARALRAVLWAVAGLAVGAAIEMGGIVCTSATHSPYNHVEERPAFPIIAILAPLGLLYGALPGLRYRKQIFGAVALVALVGWMALYRVWEIKIR